MLQAMMECWNWMGGRAPGPTRRRRTPLPQWRYAACRNGDAVMGVADVVTAMPHQRRGREPRDP